jgi:hypothetical protein
MKYALKIYLTDVYVIKHDLNTQNRNLTCSFLRVYNLVSHTTGRAMTESVCDIRGRK